MTFSWKTHRPGSSLALHFLHTVKNYPQRKINESELGEKCAVIISSDVRDCKARVRNAGKFQQFHSFDQQKNEWENWLRLGAKVQTLK